eukprot:NODE_4770_length_752_cov_73.862400_g4747_i0.p1 GENE.NODE_4770_length_752_cov_73.862400_g4747_i0~~NODE_4770_length_752_cov_73.862400_g4747_i0.p1  ORF type:complete len:190 (+),score=28.88 NODE_4770_length_752_cov_73.862400_g4747_i0:81-650(+)
MNQTYLKDTSETRGFAQKGGLQTGTISGYTGHMPGSDQSFGVNFGIQKKITGGLLTNPRKPEEEAAVKSDKWGNSLQTDPQTKPQLVNLYLKALDPERDIDFEAGVDKPKSVKAIDPATAQKKQVTKPDSILQNMNYPFKAKTTPQAPVRIVGFAGHRPGAASGHGESFNRQEVRDPRYANQVTYQDMQ